MVLAAAGNSGLQGPQSSLSSNEFALSPSRRVIFPTVSGQPRRKREEANVDREAHMDSADALVLPKISRTISLQLSGASSRGPESQSRNLQSILPLSPLGQRMSEDLGRPSTQTSLQCPALRVTNDRVYAQHKPPKINAKDLDIPPFKRKDAATANAGQDSVKPALGRKLSASRKSSSLSYHHSMSQEIPSPPTDRPLAKLPLKSILRKRTPDNSISQALDSVPSLVPLNKEDEDSEGSTSTSTIPSRNTSSEFGGTRVSFDPRVWVNEFRRSQEEYEATWFSQDDMDLFKRQTLARIHTYQRQNELLPTGTGRLVKLSQRSKAVYALEALSLDGEDDGDDQIDLEAKAQIRNILVVDPKDLFLVLFARSFKFMLPHVHVVTARSSEEALRRIKTCGHQFDIVVVEERLKLFHRQALPQVSQEAPVHFSSGSALIRALSRDGSTGMVQSRHQEQLFVAVSCHSEDRAALEKSGADLVWSKPPPKMDEALRNKILKMLLTKRSNHSAVSRLFGSST